MADLRRDIEALAKLRNDTATSAADRSQAAALGAQASALRDAEKGWRGVATQAKEAKSSLGGLAETMAGFGRSAIGGAGLGGIGSILAAGSIGAAVSAVGIIVGQSIRMAYEFEKASTRAAQQLSIGSGPNLAANVDMIQRASRAGLVNNISRQEMAQAMQTYGLASGAGVSGVANAAAGIGTYARGYGLDPQMVAQSIGQAVALSGRSFNSEAAGIFGAAEDAGPLGRRLPEFLSVATSTLATLQAANSQGNYSGGESAALVANVAKAGGYYGTAAGANAYLNATGSLINFAGSQGGIARGVASGINPLDILLNRGGPENERKTLQYYARLAGPAGANQEFAFINAMEGQGVSPDQARAIHDRLYDANGRPRGGSLEAAINQSLSTSTPSQAGESARAAQRAAQYRGTGLGAIDKLGTDIQEKQLEMGESILKGFEKVAGNLDKLLNGDWKSIGVLLAAALATNSALTLLNSLALLKSGGGGLGWLKNLFRGGGAAAEAGEAAAGAEGAAGAAAGGGGIAALLGGLGVGALAGGVTVGLFGGLAQLMGGSARMQEVDDIAHGYTPGAAAALANSAAAKQGRSTFTSAQAAALNRAAAKYGIPPALLAGIALQEHGGAVSNADQVGGNGKGWFQIDSGYHMDWLKGHSMGHDFGSAAEYAASMIANTWKLTHSVDAVGQVYNAGHIGGKTTVNDRGTYEQGLKMAIEQVVADGGVVSIPDGQGGHVTVKNVSTVTHHPAKKPNTQSRIKTR
jgi:hypothetical protein